jgi:hypothetical protein
MCHPDIVRHQLLYNVIPLTVCFTDTDNSNGMWMSTRLVLSVLPYCAVRCSTSPTRLQIDIHPQISRPAFQYLSVRHLSSQRLGFFRCLFVFIWLCYLYIIYDYCNNLALHTSPSSAYCPIIPVNKQNLIPLATRNLRVLLSNQPNSSNDSQVVAIV